METLFIYLIKSGGLLAAFFLAYYFLLRKETFFNSNRWFLLLGLVTSLFLPLVTFKKIIWVDPLPQQLNWSEIPRAAQVEQGFEIDWFIVVALVYAIGIFIFFLKFVFDFGSLVKTLKGQQIQRQADFKFVDINQNVSPFSYFNYIVYNSSLYSASELENILEHEKVHCEQKHSADVLIARFFCILFWFNPFAWLYKRAMLQNLEFIADSEALKNISDKKAYQITLLKVTTHENCVEITNHFYQSLIKKRIIMLNKNQSQKWNSWKYALIVPVLAAFMFYFQVKVIAQERNNPEKETTAATESKPIKITLNKNTTDAQLEAYSREMKAQHNVKLKFSKVKRNRSGEITAIKVQYTDKNNKSGTWQVNGDEPIKTMGISLNDGAIAFGNPKSVHIIRTDNGNTTVTDVEAPEPPAPPIPGCATSSYTYSYSSDDDNDTDVPEPPMPDMPDFKNNVFVKTITNKDGKVVVTVNGEVIDVDVDKILADIDIENITNQARNQADIARKQIEASRPQIEKARRQMRESRIESEEQREEIQNAREALEESRRELEEARKELDKSKKEFERQKVELKSKSRAAKTK